MLICTYVRANKIATHQMLFLLKQVRIKFDDTCTSVNVNIISLKKKGLGHFGEKIHDRMATK